VEKEMQTRGVRHIDPGPGHHQQQEVTAMIAVFEEDQIARRSERTRRIGKEEFLCVKKRAIIPVMSTDEIPDLYEMYHRAAKRDKILVDNMVASRLAMALVVIAGVQER
jgi:hypothetical protein